MRSITRLATGGILAAGTMLGLTLASGPAMAQGCTGSSCQEGASVVVQATITETLNPGSFTFNNGQPVTAGGQTGPQQANSSQACPGQWDITTPNATTELCADYVVNVSTGDGNGYVVQASALDLSNGKGGTIPASDLQIARLNGDITGGGKAPGGFTPLSTTPTTYITANGASQSGGDNFPIADLLNVPGSANGTYQTELTYAAIAN